MGEGKEKGSGHGSQPIDPRHLRLRIYPDAILRAKAEAVEEFDEGLHLLMEKMLTFMRRHKGIGLAAPQVGLSRRIIVADIGTGPVALANPEVLGASGKEGMVEGCLSLPGVEVNVPRKKRLVVKGITDQGKEVKLSVKHLMARVIQHEIDHLNGILICDYEPTIEKGAIPARGR